MSSWCVHETERLKKYKIFGKKKNKEKMHYMTREETAVLSAKARLQWTRRRPRSLPYIPNAYKQPGRATKSSLNSYDSKQTNWDSIWTKLLVCFHPNTAAEMLLKISVSSRVLRRCDWDKGASVTCCSKTWCEAQTGWDPCTEQCQILQAKTRMLSNLRV